MSSGDDVVNAVRQNMKAELDKCQTKEDYEQFVRKKSDATKWWLISGVVLCIVTLIGGLASNDPWNVFFWVFGSFAIIATSWTPLAIRPVLKLAKAQLNCIVVTESYDHAELLTQELLQDLSFVKEVSKCIFNREVSDIEAKVLRKYYIYWETEVTDDDGEKENLFLNIVSNYNNSLTKQDIRNGILNRLRTDDEVKGWFYSTFKTTVEDYYDLTNQVFSKDEVISSCSKFWFGGSGDKYHSEIKEMCHWLENEKGHILSQLILDGGDDNWANILYDKKDIFLKLFNEWNSTSVNVESNVINEESIEQPTTEAPQTPQEESNFGGIVLN